MKYSKKRFLAFSFLPAIRKNPPTMILALKTDLRRVNETFSLIALDRDQFYGLK